jgi:hypothetical protein
MYGQVSSPLSSGVVTFGLTIVMDALVLMATRHYLSNIQPLAFRLLSFLFIDMLSVI